MRGLQDSCVDAVSKKRGRPKSVGDKVPLSPKPAGIKKRKKKKEALLLPRFDECGSMDFGDFDALGIPSVSLDMSSGSHLI